MTVKVKFFALARDAAQVEETVVNLANGATTSTLMSALLETYPALRPWSQFVRIAVNLEYTNGDKILQEGDEVAIIPPVSGG